MVVKRGVLFDPAGKMRTLHIWLPDDYFRSDERYPVMYFFDGHNLFSDADATYGKSWGLAEFLPGWEKKMIVVGIECSHEGSMRLVEYCPYHVKGGFLGEIDGTGAATLDWMAYTLKPMIDSEYRTYGFREAAGIAGSSMGGLMSIYGVIRHNDVFSKAGCLSSSISICMRQLYAEIDRANLSPDTRIYLSWGTEEGGSKNGDDREGYMARTNRAITGRLNDEGVLTALYCQHGGRHCEADWEKQVPAFMNFLWLDRPVPGAVADVD